MKAPTGRSMPRRAPGGHPCTPSGFNEERGEEIRFREENFTCSTTPDLLPLMNFFTEGTRPCAGRASPRKDWCAKSGVRAVDPQWGRQAGPFCKECAS